MLIEAFKQAALLLGSGDYRTLLQQAGIPWIENVADEFYEGTAIAELPNISDDIKLAVLNNLHTQGNALPVEKAELKAAPAGQFTTKGTQFFLNGQPFRFVGVNVREIAYYGYNGWNDGRYTNAGHIDIQLETAKRMRAQVFLLYAPYNRNASAEKTDTKEAIKRLKNILDKAEKLNMFVLITLDDAKQSGFNVSCNNQKYREPGFVYNMEYYYSGYKESFIPFIKEVVSALGGHKGLFAWGICNESQINPFVPPTPPIADCQAFLDFYQHCSETIRSLAPNDLITTSIESCHHLFVVNAYEQKKFANTLYGMPTIDFATIHSYQDNQRMDNTLGHNAERGSFELSLARDVWKIPLIIEEMGPVGGLHRGSGGWVKGALQEWFRLGAAGCMQWGFSAVDGDIGVGDADSGMHNVPAGHPGLPGQDWQILFDSYKYWGDQFWIGK